MNGTDFSIVSEDFFHQIPDVYASLVCARPKRLNLNPKSSTFQVSVLVMGHPCPKLFCAFPEFLVGFYWSWSPLSNNVVFTETRLLDLV